MIDEDVPVTEESPLLPEVQPDAAPETQHAQRIVALLTIAMFMLCTAMISFLLPQLRIIENILCRKYYDNSWSAGEIDEKLCKVDEIQSELAYIMGITSMLEAIPGLVFSIPYGLLSDRIGRKPVLWLTMTGFLINLLLTGIVLWFWQIFPVRLVWLAPLALTIGGGDAVLNLLVYTIIADISSESQRTISFFHITLGLLMAEVIGTPLASELMRFSPWHAFIFGNVLFALGIIPIFFIPETLHAGGKTTKAPPESLEPHLNIEDDGPQITAQKFWPVATSRFRHGVSELSHSLSILKSLPLVLLLIGFVTTPLTTRVPQFVAQYISKRFDWPLARLGYLFSARGMENIFLLLVLLPAASRLLRSPRFRFGFSPLHSDLFLARASVIFLVVGALLIAGPNIYIVIAGIFIFTLGTGFATFSRSVITTLVDQEHRGRLYALISVANTIGILASGPIMAWLFSMGMKLHGYWLGLPYFFVTLLFTLVGISVSIVRLVPRPGDVEETLEVVTEE